MHDEWLLASKGSCEFVRSNSYDIDIEFVPESLMMFTDAPAHKSEEVHEDMADILGSKEWDHKNAALLLGNEIYVYEIFGTSTNCSFSSSGNCARHLGRISNATSSVAIDAIATSCELFVDSVDNVDHQTEAEKEAEKALAQKAADNLRKNPSSCESKCSVTINDTVVYYNNNGVCDVFCIPNADCDDCGASNLDFSGNMSHDFTKYAGSLSCSSYNLNDEDSCYFYEVSFAYGMVRGNLKSSDLGCRCVAEVTIDQVNYPQLAPVYEFEENINVFTIPLSPSSPPPPP